jgi:hypothetical protein
LEGSAVSDRKILGIFAVFARKPTATGVIPSRTTAEKGLTPDSRFSQGALPLASLLAPALSSVRHAQARLDRHLAALQLIEALRWHATTNGGRLPVTLDEVKVVPLPLNPATGKPFAYRLENGVGLLELPRLPGSKPESRYEIVVRPAGR